MSNKVDEKTLQRIRDLKKIGLTDKVISIRLGISERTIRVYTRATRENSVPYHPEQKLDVPSEDFSETSS